MQSIDQLVTGFKVAKEAQITQELIDSYVEIVILENPTFDNYMGLKFTLEKMFHKKVDLVIEENLKPAMRYVKEEALYAKGL